MFQLKWMLRAAGVVVCGAVVFASGGDGGTHITLRIPNEIVPAGGMVQMKVLTTEVTPISGGRPGSAFDGSFFEAAAGFGMFNPSGDTAGAAVITGTHVQISYASTVMLAANYPILTMVLLVRPDVAVGSQTLFTMDPGSIWNYSTAGVAITAKPITPATVAIGGTVSITDVIAGEGIVPAGTVIRVRGIGFDSRTQLHVNDSSVKAFSVVSPHEIRYTLPQATNVTGLKIMVANPDNSATYFAYLRGITSQVSARTLLATVEPIFALNARPIATLGPFGPLAANQYAALALQNPSVDEAAEDAVVHISLHAGDGTMIHQSSLTLASRHRLVLELSELLDGVAPTPDSYVVVRTSAPIDVFSLVCDEGSWTVAPSLPR
ncbi:MAG TPA: hypothetical protein VKI43_14710 [Vicinamibacterales bacterium]|nr:hypothetical protein [Vicinamibacterales bacterium]